MECSSNWEFKTLINELSQGLDQARQLKVHLNSPTSEVQDLLVQRILSSFEKSLLILKWSGSVAQANPAPPPSGGLESSLSVDGSPRNEDLNQSFKDQQSLRPQVSKKRKTLPTWTEQVRVNSENGLEGPADDGYSWRKYGQKDILGAKYPRSYYRCTYRHMQNCWATKQVQRSDDDTTVFDITYKGAHTCNQVTNNLAAPSTSSEKQEMKHSNDHNSIPLQQQPNEMLISFRTNLRVNTTGESENDTAVYPFAFPSNFTYIEGENQLYPTSTLADENLLGAYSPAFMSPAATTESNYFSMTTSHMNSLGGTNYLQHSESDLTDILSANASATNSPNAGLDFSVDPADLDPNFAFSMSGFFT